MPRVSGHHFDIVGSLPQMRVAQKPEIKKKEKEIKKKKKRSRVNSVRWGIEEEKCTSSEGKYRRIYKKFESKEI